MEELLFTEEEKKYFEAERLHEEKFGEPPMFIGFIDYSDENQVEMIYNAIRTNKPLKEKLPSHFRNKKGLLID